MIKCLYCGELKNKDQFNKEHVIPQSFGKFGTNTPTLEIVCKKCNQCFGDTIDRELGRSGLNINKFRSGRKKTFDAKKDFKDQELKISEGIYKGLSVTLSPSNPKLITKPLGIDFGLRREDGGYDWYSLSALPSQEEVRAHPKHPEWIRIDNFDKKAEIIQTLENKFNISLYNMQDINNENALVDLNFKITEPILRSVYKTAFNFLAHYFIKHNMSYILYDSCFDPIKQYIRFGLRSQWDGYPPREFTNHPVISNEDPSKAILAHVLTFEVNPDASVTSSVAFYNEIHFRLTLAINGYPGVIYWRFGQNFCPNSNQVIDLKTEGVFV